MLTYKIPFNARDALKLAGLQARIELDAFSSMGINVLADVEESQYGRLERVSKVHQKSCILNIVQCLHSFSNGTKVFVRLHFGKFSA